MMKNKFFTLRYIRLCFGYGGHSGRAGNIKNSFFTAITHFTNTLRMYLMPSICAYCKNFIFADDVFCASCKDKIFPIVSKKIDITAQCSVTVFAIFDYKDPLKKLILAKSWSDF